ncbi:hypothetical protein PENSPDRAFT_301078 [Peniophora sp. CONT]|nr:hypothetical protein PENSPDRAFT_301078 [Peniophora sp. CONT]
MVPRIRSSPYSNSPSDAPLTSVLYTSPALSTLTHDVLYSRVISSSTTYSLVPVVQSAISTPTKAALTPVTSPLQYVRLNAHHQRQQLSSLCPAFCTIFSLLASFGFCTTHTLCIGPMIHPPAFEDGGYSLLLPRVYDYYNFIHYLCAPTFFECSTLRQRIYFQVSS